MTTVLHVSTAGSDAAAGTASAPFRTINHAAALARAGDTVVVHGGEYREWVRPRRGGLSDTRRVTYEAASGEHVVIKGSERVADWQDAGGGVWRADVPNALFGDFNPFAELIRGDWIVRPGRGEPERHLGEVYLNGRSFYEVSSRQEVASPQRRTEVLDDWTQLPDRVRDADQTMRVWYADVGETATTIWANFGEADPNAELVEINVRRSVFYPDEHHIDYVTVRGFELAHAACPWTPPTADQPGLIGPNWAKGWIIEDNAIHDAKCSAISLGKEASTGNNNFTERGDKPGYQYQLESVFSARQIGWDAEHIGSHVVRRNTIYDCGQNGVVGHLGCVFSTIEDNHIYNIALKREFYGHEIAGIKLHAAIDVHIVHNRIHDCSLGIWLDWQTQGTRVTRNVLHANNRDLFVEVSHGPYVVDHNILGSGASLEDFSQGGAYLHNLVRGSLRIETVLDRATPYHRPHSTQVAGFAAIHGGDNRFVGNLFVGDAEASYGFGPGENRILSHGTDGYDGHPGSFAEYLEQLAAREGDHRRFFGVRQPVYVRDNAYAGAARPYAAEVGAVTLPSASVRVVEEGDAVYLEADLPGEFGDKRVDSFDGRALERVRFVDAEFEERDGRPLQLATDLLGDPKRLGDAYAPGPIGALGPGTSRTRVW